MYPYPANTKNEQIKDTWAFKKSMYIIYKEFGKHTSMKDKALFAYEIPLKDMIESFEEIDLFKHRERREEEFFIPVGNRYFYVTLTSDFYKWVMQYIGKYDKALKFIKQSNADLDIYLLKISGGTVWDFWLDYKTGEEVRKFFKIN